MPSANDHVKTIVEMLRGETPDLLRRWLSALLLVPEREREAIVAAVEYRIVNEYPIGAPTAPAGSLDEPVGGTADGSAGSPRRVRVVSPPKQRDGYTEQVERVYEVVDEPGQRKAKRGDKRSKQSMPNRASANRRRNNGSA